MLIDIVVSYESIVSLITWIWPLLVGAAGAVAYWGRKLFLWAMVGWSFIKSEYTAILQDRVLLRSIAAELRPNGGSSLRDAITSVESQSAKLGMALGAVLDDQVYGSFESDTNGLCIRVNEEYLRMTDSDLEDVIGNGWVLGIVDRDRGRVYTEWHAAIDQCRDFDAVYTMMNRTTLDEFRVRCKAKAVRVASGKITGYYGTVRKLNPDDMRNQKTICSTSSTRQREHNAAEHDTPNVVGPIDRHVNVSGYESDTHVGT